MNSRPTAYCLPPTAYYSSPTACRPLVLACCLLLAAGCSKPISPAEAAARNEATMRANAVGPGGGPPSGTLDCQVGDPLPELKGEGWLNGPPPSADELEGHVVVVDIWNDVCGMCRVVAPDLLRLREKYEDRGVVFIGYTGRKKVNAEAFTQNSAIPWPNAYGVASLGGAGPVIYVIGADGRIAWCDERARLAHEIASLGADLEAAIERALLDSRQ